MPTVRARTLVWLFALAVAVTGHVGSASAQSATYTFSGVAHNLAVDRSTGVAMTVSRAATGLWTTTGAFDGVSLFGRFSTVPGRDLECEDVSPGATCLLFVGVVAFGDDGSGFPSGTVASLTIALTIRGASATGVYRIGPVDGYDHDQYGTLELVRR